MTVFWVLVSAALVALTVLRLRAGLTYGLTGGCALTIALLTLVHVMRGSR